MDWRKDSRTEKTARSSKIEQMDPTPMGENGNGSMITEDEATFADRLIERRFDSSISSDQEGCSIYEKG
jgi:hypothetical protein